MKKKATTNTFAELNMDTSPLATANTSMTNALNAALVTLNGDEKVLLNAMGNGRVESAYLPEGYIPIGTCELGGIIYIVSYNPLIDKCLIGSFPSPERNVTSDELSDAAQGISNGDFVISKLYTNACDSADSKLWELTTISAVEYKLKLTQKEDGSDYILTPGDKFKIYVDKPNDGSDGALTANAPTISDIYSDEPDIINETPRYITLRVIAIGDDLKISYLDNGLVWNYNINKDETGGDYGYYISELEESSSGKVDLDSYRGLTTSGYSIYTGKINGVLALLCEIKAVDTFSVGWDADVDNVDNPMDLGLSPEVDKCATIKFYIQYTSSSPRINLKYVLVTGSSLSQVIKPLDDSPNLQCGADFGTGWILPTFDPKEYSNNNNAIERKNDNTDEELTLTTEPFYYSSNSDLYNIVWDYLLTPAMPFGNIDWLAVKGSINFSEIGSGKINIVLWKYWVLNETTTISWGLEAYPEKNKEIKEVCFSFIPFTWLCENNIEDISISQSPEEYKELGLPFYQYWIREKKSYSGYFLDIIGYDNSAYIYKNGLFLVDIFIRYGSIDNDSFDNRHIYRWLYTTGLWNELYLNSEIDDFNDLYLTDIISIGATFDVADNINTVQYSSSLSLPSTIDTSWNLWNAMGAMATTVNYDELDNKFDADANSFIIDTDINISMYNELFGLDIVSNDVSVDYNLNTAYITHDTVKVKTTNTSDNSDRVASLFMDTISAEEESTKELDGVNDSTQDLIVNINNADYWRDNNSELKDSFNAKINYNANNKTHLTVIVQGVIISKINAQIDNQECVAQTMLRPVLYEHNDLSTVGLIINRDENGNVSSTMSSGVLVTGSSNGLLSSKIEFGQYGLNLTANRDGGRTRFDTGLYAGATYEKTREVEYKGNDEQDYENWDNIPSKIRLPFVTGLDQNGGIFNMSKMVDAGYSDTNKEADSGKKSDGTVYYDKLFKIYHNSSAERKLFEHDYPQNDSNSRTGAGGGLYILWIKSGGIWNTLNCLAPEKNQLAALVACIYSSLYVLINSSTKIQKAIVTNIDYVSDYQETWNTGINTTIKGVTDTHIKLKYDNKDVSDLETLLTIITLLIEKDTALDISLNNISLGLGVGESLTRDIPTYTVSHTFTLRNTALYEAYLKESSTSVPCLAYTGRHDGGYITLEDTPLSSAVYVYDAEENNFELVADAPEHVYYVRTLYLTSDNLILWENPTFLDVVGTGENAKNIFKKLVNNDGMLEIPNEIIPESTTTLFFNTRNLSTTLYDNNRVVIWGNIFKPNLGVNYVESNATTLTNLILIS